MQEFIYEQNIASFVRQLEHELDPGRRATLKSLLLEEENKFGRATEILDRVDRLISDGQARIARQGDLIKRLRSQGHAVCMAEALLENLKEIQRLYFATRERLKGALNQFSY
jgi:hypothetical protein